MHKIKCRVLNKYGIPENLSGAKTIEFEFDCENTDKLVKSMENKHVKLLDHTKGEVEVELSDFEIQGLPALEKQTFYAKINILGEKRMYRFTELLNVKLDGERKAII